MIDSQVFPSVHLTEIYRQAETSDIVRAAHAIYAGQYPVFEKSKQFHVVHAEDERLAFAHIMEMASKLHDKGVNFQILSPRHGGPLGVTNLNANLREMFNPASPGIAEVSVGNNILRERDRIMVTKNEYQLGVFNGDIGKILSFSKDRKEVVVRVYGSPDLEITLPVAKATRLIRLAYAMTIHKFQGLEQDVIIVPILNNFGLQLQRNLYYTAITRARKKVILVGHPEALSRAIANVSGMARDTLLTKRLKGE
jgi:exodeoxyribonuclease V alpha subunit